MYNVVDLFAGPGGLSLGFEMLKDKKGDKVFNLLKAIEKDTWACQTLRKNFSDGVVIEGDLREEKVKKMIENECKGKTDIVVAGPPCQSFSLIGPRSGNGKNGIDQNKYDSLYNEFIEVVKKLNPQYVIFENVKGILSKINGNKKVIDTILYELRKLGYSCGGKDGYFILNAADYGVPQTRERVFIVGNKTNTENIIPEKTHYDPRKGQTSDNLLPHVTIRDAIGDLPKLKAKKTLAHTKKSKSEIERYNKKIYSGSEKVIYKKEWAKDHLSKTDKKGKEFFRFVRPFNRIPLTHHTARSQMETDILLFGGMRQGTTAKDVIHAKKPKIKKLAKFIRYDMNSFSDKYKKHSWSRPCSTIFAHMSKDGNRFIHPDGTQARTFTPREAARLQSFPDSFYFEGPITRKFQQIGNAVPPLLAMKLAESLTKMINGF